MTEGTHVEAKDLALEFSSADDANSPLGQVVFPLRGRVASILVAPGDTLRPDQDLFGLQLDESLLGRRPDSFMSLAVSVDGKCARCATELPIHTVAETLECPECHSVLKQGLLWPDVFDCLYDDALLIARGWEPDGRLRVNSSDAGFSQVTCGVSSQCPTCECGRAFPVEMLKRCMSDEVIPCESCHQPLKYQRVTADSARLTGRFGKSILALIEGEAPGSSTAHRAAISVKCSHCGASLTADATSRNVHCKFCNATDVLSEDIWRQICAPRRLKPLYVLFRPDGETLRSLLVADQTRRFALKIEAEKNRRYLGVILGILALVGMMFFRGRSS